MRIKPRDVLWDAWNVAHVARHGLTRLDVEEVLVGPYQIVPSYKSRLVLLGPRGDGRVLVVVLDPEPAGLYYCVSARKANAREVRRYHAGQGGAP